MENKKLKKFKHKQHFKNTNKNKTSKKTFTKKIGGGKLEEEEIRTLQGRYETLVWKNVSLFTDLPLSRKTQRGLKANNYVKPTEIQRQAISYALQGRDVLGAAITGSGKTLAFLIPVMENLFTKKWVRQDGVGAIIISPTRELAYQIFETLKKVGAHHDFSAGLIIGGKNLKFERSRMDQCNVVICTPGRLLQHMDENPLFNCDSMQILVLDEADRCLDMGFEQTMNAIIENLPPKRQTLLFSATQTKSVKDLARLSLTNPVYVAPHEQSVHSTPDTLKQNYVVIDLEDKITMLWSFIKNHLKQKCIVFMSTCKQVKYTYEILCKLRPGTSVLALYGTLHQDRRMAIYDEFCRKSNVVLLATDVASRGLDFPVVNWVIQLDCPEDATAYIHRAGRTARNTAQGESLLVLLPSEEEAMIEELKERKIPINKIHIDPKKMFSPRAKIEAFLAQNNELKQSAQRAVITYIKSVALMKNKECFKVDKLNIDKYAQSLGLVVSPRIRFLNRIRRIQERKNLEQAEKSTNGTANDDDDDNDDSGESEDEEIGGKSNGQADSDSASESESETSESDDERPANPKNTDIDFNTALMSDNNDDSDDGFIKIKRRDHEIQEDSLPEVPPLEEAKTKRKQKVLTKAAVAKRLIKKKIMPNKKVTFDEDGAEVETLNTLKSELAKEYEHTAEDGIDIEKAKELLREEDKFDKQRFRELVKAKRKEKKRKMQNKEEEEEEDQDDFGSGDESDGPDLSWLPDPDKLSDNERDDNSDDDTAQFRRQVVNSSDESDSDDYAVSSSKKRNRDDSEEGSDVDDDTDSVVQPPVTKKIRNITSKLSVDEAELFAMKLLQK